MSRNRTRASAAATVAVALLLATPALAGAATDTGPRADPAEAQSARFRDEVAGVGPVTSAPVDPTGSLSGSTSTGTTNPGGETGFTTSAVSVEYSPAGCEGKTD